MKNLMLDIETAGKKPGCPILSIAVVPFEKPADYLYIKCHYESQLNSGFIQDQETMAWWAGQPEAAYNEAFSGQAPLKDSLYNLSAYLAVQGEAQLWSCGTDFDFPVLVHAFNHYNIPVPWAYNAINDYRTLKKLFSYVKVGENLNKHNALADATYQAEHCQAILNWVERCRKA